MDNYFKLVLCCQHIAGWNVMMNKCWGWSWLWENP